jgi:hypothetical protein
MKVEPEIEMTEREPMKPRTNTINEELRRRARRELAFRKKSRRREPSHHNADFCEPWGD